MKNTLVTALSLGLYFAVATTAFEGSSAGAAQEAPTQPPSAEHGTSPHQTQKPAARSERLSILGPDANGSGASSQAYDSASFKLLPHTTLEVTNGHTSAKERYSGVLLADLLEKAHVPIGKELKGKAFLGYITATGTDGYSVVYSLAEIDREMHPGIVLVADQLNDQPIGAEGAFKLVNSEDKRPARWVHNLMSLEYRVAK